jgi:hypothetical protein
MVGSGEGVFEEVFQGRETMVVRDVGRKRLHTLSTFIEISILRRCLLSAVRSLSLLLFNIIFIILPFQVFLLY